MRMCILFPLMEIIHYDVTYIGGKTACEYAADIVKMWISLKKEYGKTLSTTHEAIRDEIVQHQVTLRTHFLFSNHHSPKYFHSASKQT